MKRARFIVHVDMDAFFASIEARDRPSLRGKPVVVGSDPRGGSGRGVVSTCSYEARKYGIRSAMPISEAWRKCPNAVFLPVDFRKYEEASARIYEILYSFSPDIEPVGIDEAFLDITGSWRLFGSPVGTCAAIKEKIKKMTGLTASVGLAPIKMAAKIASDLDKPDGLVAVTADGLIDFLRPLEVRKIWGLGPKCEAGMHALGIRTIGELAARDPKDLARAFGKSGLAFWRLANGIDESAVETEREAKSVSNEMTFDVDTIESQRIGSALMWLCEKVSLRMRASGLECRTVTLKIRLSDFSTFTRSATLEMATNFIDVLHGKVKSLYRGFDNKGKKVRLVGVRAANLCSRGFPDTLFEDPANVKREAAHRALAAIKQKFGDGSIFMAGSRA